MAINLKSFKNCFVEVLTDRYISVTNETEHGRFENKKPLVLSGYLLDFDDEWVYIGITEETVTDMIKLKRIVTISQSAKHDEFEKMLDDVETPDSDEGFN